MCVYVHHGPVSDSMMALCTQIGHPNMRYFSMSLYIHLHIYIYIYIYLYIYIYIHIRYVSVREGKTASLLVSMNLVLRNDYIMRLTASLHSYSMTLEWLRSRYRLM
jgi:hypothetical protein